MLWSFLTEILESSTDGVIVATHAASVRFQRMVKRTDGEMDQGWLKIKALPRGVQ